MPTPNRREFLASSAALAASTLKAGDPAPPVFPFFEPVTPPRRTQAMMHRGMAMLAPENTLPAIEACAADFIEWAEIDVRLTRDGAHVLLHDATLDRTTNGNGPVNPMDLAELQKLDAGAWFAPRFTGLRIPTLKQALEAAKEKVNLYLDCKHVDPDTLVHEIVAARMQRQVVVYDSPEAIARVRKASNGQVATMTKYWPRVDLKRFLDEVRPSAVEIDADDVTAELCRAFHAAGIKVQAKLLGAKWDNPATWARVVDAGIDWAQTDDAAGFRMWEARRRWPAWPVKMACHRGASRYAPENTIPALADAARLGADYIEIDIRPTRDGRFVLLHDRMLNRTTNGAGPVNERSFEEVAALHAGRWFGKPFAETRVPTLDDALVAIGSKAYAYLDAKDIPPADLLAAIHKHGLMKRHVVYQSPEYLKRLKQLDPAVRLLPPLRSADQLGTIAGLKPFGVDAAWSALSKDLIERCHALGIQVFSDALGRNDRVEEHRKAIGWGIDVIQTDHPLRLLRAVELAMSSR